MVVRKKQETAGNGQSTEPGKYRVGDRVWYKNEVWYIEKDTGGTFVRIIEDPHSEKSPSQSVPRVTVMKNDIPNPGIGKPRSSAEISFKKNIDEPRKAARERSEVDKAADGYWKKEKREKGKKHDREVKPKNPNLIPLKKICGEINVDPKLARRLLRAEKSIPRPEGRWEFDPKDVERIKKLISQPS